MDDTIAPSLYRTGKGDRAIPFGLGSVLAVCVPVLGILSGPYLWPWGTGAMVLTASVAAGAFVRWWSAMGSVQWREIDTTLVFRRGRRERSVACEDLDRVRVVPAAARTTLGAGSRQFVLSHRLVRVERLLDRLRALRPDLFPVPGDVQRFRASWSGVVTLGVLALGTAGAGLVLAPWQPWVGGLFFASAGLVVLRALWSVPRAYLIGSGRITVLYLVRKRTWNRPTAVREDAYPAGGAVFFRMRFDYQGRTLVLDEGILTDPLRPWAGWIVHQLAAPEPS
jgi:hypothetical protein